MTDRDKRQVVRVKKLAEDVSQNISDLLRLRSMRNETARMFRDMRLMRWLASEARAVAREGIEPDPWGADEVDVLAERIRVAVVADRSGVRQIPGRPSSVTRSEFECRSEGVSGVAVPWVQLATAAGIGRELWDEDCDTWIALPDDLPRGRYVALNVKGESMTPLLHDADVVLVNMAAHAKPGDIVLARATEGYVVKRLVRIAPTGVELESLNSDFAPITIRDDSRPIVGVVVLRWCEHGKNLSTSRIT